MWTCLLQAAAAAGLSRLEVLKARAAAVAAGGYAPLAGEPGAAADAETGLEAGKGGRTWLSLFSDAAVYVWPESAALKVRRPGRTHESLCILVLKCSACTVNADPGHGFTFSRPFKASLSPAYTFASLHSIQTVQRLTTYRFIRSQARVVLCLVLVLLMRVLNLGVPILYKRLVDRLAGASAVGPEGRPSFWDLVRTFLRLLFDYVILFWLFPFYVVCPNLYKRLVDWQVGASAAGPEGHPSFYNPVRAVFPLKARRGAISSVFFTFCGMRGAMILDRWILPVVTLSMYPVSLHHGIHRVTSGSDIYLPIGQTRGFSVPGWRLGRLSASLMMQPC